MTDRHRLASGEPRFEFAALVLRAAARRSFLSVLSWIRMAFPVPASSLI
jgi:hypothetical protein